MKVIRLFPLGLCLFCVIPECKELSSFVNLNNGTMHFKIIF
jgi:hypothetical protein